VLHNLDMEKVHRKEMNFTHFCIIIIIIIINLIELCKSCKISGSRGG
jgi:hypothetical protein